MLILTRKPGEWLRVVVGEVVVWLQVSEVDRNKVRLAVDAPREVEVSREELLPAYQRRTACPGGAGGPCDLNSIEGL